MLFAPVDKPIAGKNESSFSTDELYFRLIALWVICEAMIGGIIHGFRLPVSGLVVGSCAVICISLIGYYRPVKGAILRATIIVAIFKMMLSPQAPVTAYIAVMFQGLLGELLFNNRKFFRTACLVLAVLALLESATQRILILTFVYGRDFWQVLNESIYRFGGEAGKDYSYYIIFWYLLLHLIAGVLVGVWAGFLPQRISLLDQVQKKFPVSEEKLAAGTPFEKRRKKSFFRTFFLISWIFLLALWLQFVLHIGKPLMPPHIALRILIRSVIIILSWYFLVGPLLKTILQRWLQEKKKKSVRQVNLVVEELPRTRRLLAQSWQLSRIKKGIPRVLLCIRIVLANTFYPVNA